MLLKSCEVSRWMSKGMICAIPFMRTVCSITVTRLQRVRSQGRQVIHLTSTLPHTVILSLSTLVNQVLFTLMVCAFLLGMNISYSTSTSLSQEEWSVSSQTSLYIPRCPCSTSEPNPEG